MRVVTVCDRCNRTSCWQGVFVCADSDIAGTKDIPVEDALDLGVEHSDFINANAFERVTEEPTL